MATSYIGGSCTTTTAPLNFGVNKTYVTPYQITSDGIITSVCFRVRWTGYVTDPKGHVSLIILRPNGSNWDYVGESPSIEVTNSGGETVTTDCNINVKNGDIIGWYSDNYCGVDVLSVIGHYTYYETEGKQTGTNFSLPNIHSDYGDVGVVVTFNDVVDYTHIIDYDFSFLPQSFLDLIASNIVDLSNWLGTHLPIPSNIQWKGATYSGGRFRIYVIYTPPLQSPAVMSLEQFPSLISLPTMALSTFAGLIAGLVVFAVAQRLTSVLGPLYSMIIGAALGIVGGLTLSYTIYEFSSGTSTPGTAPSQTSVDKSKNIDEYIKEYVKPFCDQQYPGCATVPATCDGPTYRVYVACVQQVAQCQYDAALKGDPVTTCDPRVQEYTTIDTGLADGTMTVAEAQQRTTTNNTTINEYHNDVVKTMTCPSGQTYDPTTQKCVQTAGDCWIAGFTPGSCILTAKTGKTIAIIGGMVIGGYIIFSLIKK